MPSRPPKKRPQTSSKNPPPPRGGFSRDERPVAPGWETGKGGRAARPPKTLKPWDRKDAWAAARTKGSRPPPVPHSQARSQQVTRAVYGHTVPPSRSRLEELLVSYGVTLPGPALDKVWQYHGILRRNNGDLDLTRLIGFETIVQRHYADCLILNKLMKGQWPSPMVDIGTGAGFPGLMIKIASPSTRLILSEPRNVRVDFLNNTIKELGLKDIEVFGHKFTSKSFDRPLQGAISRAFEPIGKTLPRLEKSLAVGGLAIFMKGPGVDEELTAKLPPNYKLVRDERYRIPKTTLDRALVIFERTA